MSTNVYRLPVPGHLLPVRSRIRGPLLACPACARLFWVHCSLDARHLQVSKALGFCSALGCVGKKIVGPDSHVQTCMPNSRIRVGFWWQWWQRCAEPGVHLHQDCGACGWAGILLPALELGE